MRQSQALRSDEAFARYRPPTDVRPRRRDAVSVAGVIARKHCAGRKGYVDGEGIVSALNAEPAPNGDDGAVGWLLSSLAPHECALLVTRCGVTPRAVARHLRSRPVRNDRLVGFLNQFAA